jgi:hypothetical protein
MELIQKSLSTVEGQVVPYLYAEFDRNQLIMKNVSLGGIRKSSPSFSVTALLKPKNVHFYGMRKIFLLMLSHLNTIAATEHLPMVRLLQTEANSIQKMTELRTPKVAGSFTAGFRNAKCPLLRHAQRIFLLTLSHLNTKAATEHLPMVRLLQTEANSIQK